MTRNPEHTQENQFISYWKIYEWISIVVLWMLHIIILQKYRRRVCAKRIIGRKKSTDEFLFNRVCSWIEKNILNSNSVILLLSWSDDDSRQCIEMESRKARQVIQTILPPYNFILYLSLTHSPWLSKMNHHLHKSKIKMFFSVTFQRNLY